MDPVETVARTLWGEARGCGAVGMRHVANVIVNRAQHPTWWGNNLVGVCLQPYQFSCRNPDDPNLAKLLAVTVADPAYAVALGVAQLAAANRLVDETGGADSYYALSMRTPPTWAVQATRTFADGWHAFYLTRPHAPPGSKPSVPNISHPTGAAST